jgi:hypothetical protein
MQPTPGGGQRPPLLGRLERDNVTSGAVIPPALTSESSSTHNYRRDAGVGLQPCEPVINDFFRIDVPTPYGRREAVRVGAGSLASRRARSQGQLLGRKTP